MTEKADQGQGCTKNPERTDVQEQMPGTTGRHHRNKEPRLKTGIMSGNKNMQKDPQEDHTAGDCKANSLDCHSTVENKCENIM
jgi:hypothetical protein